MAFYYVKSGGTATGDGGRYASAKTATDDWATAFSATTEYYDSISDAIGATTAPVVSDQILCSSSHSKSESATTYYRTPADIISVDNSNVGQYLAGATETITGNNDLYLGTAATGSFFGMTIDMSAGRYLRLEEACSRRFVECEIKIGQTQAINSANDGGSIELVDTTIDYSGTSDSAFGPNGGGDIKMFGGSITSSAGGDGKVDYLTDSGFGNGGGTIELYGVDLSVIDGTLFNGVGAASFDDYINIRLDNCTLDSGVSITSEDFRAFGHQCVVTNSSSGSGASYQIYVQTYNGLAEEDTAFYRANTVAVNGTEVSLKITTTSSVSAGSPYSFDFDQFAVLSDTGSDLLRLYILSSATLTDADIFAQMYYPDGTNVHVPNHIYSVASAHDPLRTGSTLTTNTETWTGRTSENRYQIDLDTSTDAGADGVCTLRIYVTKPSATIYIDPIVDTGA